MGRAIEERFPSDDELREAVDWFFLDGEPWISILRENSRIARFRINERKQSQSEHQKDFSHLSSCTVRQLLEQATKENRRYFRAAIERIVTPADVDLLISHISKDNPAVAHVALSGLAKLGSPSIFEWIREFWSTNPTMTALIRGSVREVMISLPATLTLPLAREWLFRDQSHESWIAEHLVRAHATKEDIPMIRTAITRALADDAENCYRICNLVEAFFRFPEIGVVPEVCDVFEQFRYSYGRQIAAKAIATTAPGYFAENFALESLWDCESGTRELTAVHVRMDNFVVRSRLEEIAADPWEDKDVRGVAGKRLRG
jgi:hypothetical protein